MHSFVWRWYEYGLGRLNDNPVELLINIHVVAFVMDIIDGPNWTNVLCVLSSTNVVYRMCHANVCEISLEATLLNWFV